MQCFSTQFPEKKACCCSHLQQHHTGVQAAHCGPVPEAREGGGEHQGSRGGSDADANEEAERLLVSAEDCPGTLTQIDPQ